MHEIRNYRSLCFHIFKQKTYTRDGMSELVKHIALLMSMYLLMYITMAASVTVKLFNFERSDTMQKYQLLN